MELGGAAHPNLVERESSVTSERSSVSRPSTPGKPQLRRPDDESSSSVASGVAPTASSQVWRQPSASPAQVSTPGHTASDSPKSSHALPPTPMLSNRSGSNKDELVAASREDSIANKDRPARQRGSRGSKSERDDSGPSQEPRRPRSSKEKMGGVSLLSLIHI